MKLRAGLKFTSKHSPSYDFEVKSISGDLVAIERTSSEGHSFGYKETKSMTEKCFDDGTYIEKPSIPNDITTF